MRMGTLIWPIVVALMLTVSAGSAWAQEDRELTQTTGHYRITLEIGPVVTMLMPEQAAGAKEGEVMVHMPGTRMVMGVTDQGKPVNHHLEVHIFDNTTGTLATKAIPKIMITNQGTGKSRSLASITAMYDVKESQKDLHFGSNLFLPDGKYTVLVVVGNEKAIFKDIAVMGQ
jgi:hypothetical protein